jgi:DNA repair photolyase
MNKANRPQPVKGRGAAVNPPNRFERTRAEADWEQLEGSDDFEPAERSTPTEFFPDRSQSIIARNNSPDIPFTYSINPYRGCEHGCAYCYARPTHENFGMNAGLDFESKILVKFDAPALLRKELNDAKWAAEPISVSGVTDCYQPAERNFHITRGLLEVMHEANQPVGIVTKNALIARDLDLLAPMAARNLVHVFVSVTTLDAELARRLEPRTASPEARLRTIRRLSEVGVSVGVMVAPIIPGLNDHQVPQILEAAAEAGARSAGYVLLRLPWSVEPMFLAWLDSHYPLAKPKVEGLLRSMRCGRLYRSGFGERMRGEGPYADGVRTTFRVFVKKLRLEGSLPPLDRSQFRPPRLPGDQLRLF